MLIETVLELYIITLLVQVDNDLINAGRVTAVWFPTEPIFIRRYNEHGYEISTKSSSSKYMPLSHLDSLPCVY